MATNKISDGLASLLKASGLGGGDSVGLQMTSIADRLQQQQSINDALMQQTVAAMTQPAGSGDGGGSSASSILSTIGGVLGGGLGLAPLVSGLAGLFGGGGDSMRRRRCRLTWLRCLSI